MSFTQHHATRHLQLKSRFGRWDAILESTAPAEDLPHARAMWHYARGRALAAKGRVDEADAELARVRAAAARPGGADFRLEFNSSAAILGIASEVLAGHVAAARKDFPRAVAHLREAAKLEDALVYGEPPEWTVPVRQELGVVLLDAGMPPDAETVFRADLAKFPENGWSLNGLARAVRAQGRAAEADAISERFRRTWSSADVQLAEVAR
jgi:tetratricopeptide (TPR) repeat protein